MQNGKMFDLEAFALEETMDQDDVVKMYEEKGKKVHFGSVIALCHEKHSEMCLEDPEYKGRVVFRADIVRDPDGYFIEFCNCHEFEELVYRGTAFDPHGPPQEAKM